MIPRSIRYKYDTEKQQCPHAVLALGIERDANPLTHHRACESSVGKAYSYCVARSRREKCFWKCK